MLESYQERRFLVDVQAAVSCLSWMAGAPRAVPAAKKLTTRLRSERAIVRGIAQ